MAILGQFWVDDETPDAVRAIQLEGWLDVIDCLSEAEVRDAWANYQRTGPRGGNGALRRPDAGAIYSRAMASRGRAAQALRLVVEAEPPPPEIDAAERDRRRATAAAILATAGFRPKMFGHGGDE